METLQHLAACVGGVLCLLLGGWLLVKHSVHLAVAYRVPKTVVGAVILGFGTSAPELFVSVAAALDGSPGIAIGNVVGSNIANVGLILGLGAFMVTLHVERSVLRTDLPLGALAALFLLMWVGPQLEVSRLVGVVLLAGFVAYLWLSLSRTRRHQALVPDPAEAGAQKQPFVDGFWVLVGLALVTVGARILVWGAREIALDLEVSPRIIGLSMVALSTSLPELAAIWAAARKGEADLAVGNIAGSNIFNLLFVLGTAAAIHPIDVEPVMQVRDFPMLVLFSLLAFPLLTLSRRISRVQGGVLLASYAAYIAWTWLAK